jgi:hypothetical protein
MKYCALSLGAPIVMEIVLKGQKMRKIRELKIMLDLTM